MDWLTFAAGVVIGAFGIIVSVLIAWRQRVIQLHDRAADREQEHLHELELQEHQAKISRREQWQPEYDAIRIHLDSGETLAYRVLLGGPFTEAEFNALDLATFRMHTEILADRGIERMREPLLFLAYLADNLVQNAVPEEIAAVLMHNPNGSEACPTTKVAFRCAVLQDRTARDLAELVKKTRQTLRTEWGE